VRILSLLPSATEIVYALGLGDLLVGVTDECDHPPEARRHPIVSRAKLAPSGPLPPADVDRLVGERVARGEPLYGLDTDLIRELRPDLILAQDLCRVCAVPSGHVEEALERIGWQAQVLSLDPGRLGDVLASIAEVGRATGMEDRARRLVSDLEGRLEGVRRATSRRRRRPTLALEWPDPPFVGGHWVPDMVRVAGGEPLLGEAGAPSRRLGWEEVAASRPEVVVVMPCGYGLSRARTEAAEVAGRPELEPASEVWAVDASSSFSRPGPRLVDGVEALAAALHPGSVPEPPPGMVARVR
jgi:iron complex transport system substrate-binding protein